VDQFNQALLDHSCQAPKSFFDPSDLIQVKYEMLRRIDAEQIPVSRAAHEAGLSRPSFYQAQAAIQQSGLAGLIPQKPGPHGAHKLTAQVLDFLDRQRAGQPDRKFAELARLVQEQLGVTVHPRTIERALSRRQKTPLNAGPSRQEPEPGKAARAV